MTWTKLWMDLFGRTALCGIDMGFWAAMSVVLLLVILMNVVVLGHETQKRKRRGRNMNFPCGQDRRFCWQYRWARWTKGA